MTFSELNEFFKKRYLKTYDRNNFDKFLKAVDFSFTVPSIHVTGTNGNGSTCNFLNSIYVKNGYKVGTFVSPFFIDTKDMIYLNENHISEEEILEIFNQYFDLFEPKANEVFVDAGCYDGKTTELFRKWSKNTYKQNSAAQYKHFT